MAKPKIKGSKRRRKKKLIELCFDDWLGDQLPYAVKIQ